MGNAVSPTAGSASGLAGVAAAGAGNAGALGKLSVPPAWTAATPLTARCTPRWVVRPWWRHRRPEHPECPVRRWVTSPDNPTAGLSRNTVSDPPWSRARRPPGDDGPIDRRNRFQETVRKGAVSLTWCLRLPFPNVLPRLFLT